VRHETNSVPADGVRRTRYRAATIPPAPAFGRRNDPYTIADAFPNLTFRDPLI
jgi:hypothetical protein